MTQARETKLTEKQKAELKKLADAYVATRGPDRYRDAMDYDEIENKSAVALDALQAYVEALASPEIPEGTRVRTEIYGEIREGKIAYFDDETLYKIILDEPVVSSLGTENRVLTRYGKNLRIIR